MKQALLRAIKQFSDHSPDICEICDPLLKTTHLNGFGYIQLSTSGKFSYLANRHDWIEHFLSSKLYCGLTPNQRPEIFQYQYLISESLANNQVALACKEFNMHNLFSIIKKKNTSLEIFSFTSEKKELAFANWYLEHLSELESFCIYFEETAHQLIADSHKKSLLTLENMPNDFTEIKIDNSEEKIHQETFRKELKQLHLGKSFYDVVLSKPEINTLYHLLQGNTMKEIAQALSKSPRTIEHTLAELKKKLRVNSKSELIALFMKSHFYDLFN